MEVFFSSEPVADLATANQEKILRMEDQEATRILKLYKSIRQDLRDRLDVVGRGTFSEQQIRGALAQVEAGIRAMSDRLMSGMSDAAETVSLEGLEHLRKELNRWDRHFLGAVTPLNLNAAVVATDTKNFLVNRYETSIENYSLGLRNRLTQVLTESAIQGMNYGDVIQNVGKVFLGEEWKLQQLVRTELHNVYNLGKINGMKELWDEGEGTIPDLRKTLYHRIDKRTGKDTLRLVADNPVVKVDEPFVDYSLQKKDGKPVVYIAPPNRPNDRAILIPYREAWGAIRSSGPGPEMSTMEKARNYAERFYR